MKTWKESDGRWYGGMQVGNRYLFSATGESSRGEVELELMTMERGD
jgi:hypothetical protein